MPPVGEKHYFKGKSLPLRAEGSAGLFHTAILFQNPRELAAAIIRIARHTPQLFTGTGDHHVSQAFYLDDPEGNGVELYTDRPRESWRRVDGEIQMDTLPLDPNAYLSQHLTEDALETTSSQAGMVGHVHLQVGDLAAAKAFYVDTLGFEATQSRYPGALFASAGGYHHHLGMNTWESRGAGERSPALGLGGRRSSEHVPGSQLPVPAPESVQALLLFLELGHGELALGDLFVDLGVETGTFRKKFGPLFTPLGGEQGFEPSRVGFVARRVDVPALVEEFAATSREEIDYLHEGVNAERFGELFSDGVRVAAPTVVWERTTPRVLTLSDVTAIKLNDVDGLRAAGIDPAEVAQTFAEVMFEQLFGAGFFHADPHPGNVFVTPHAPDAAGRTWTLTFIDFGMMGHVPPELRAGLRRIVIAVAARDGKGLVAGIQQIGVLLPSADTTELERALTELFARFGGLGFGELQDVDPREFQAFADEFGEAMRELPVQLPENFLLITRAVSLTSGVCSALDPGFNVWHAVEPFAQRLLREESRGALTDAAKSVFSYAKTIVGLPVRIDQVAARIDRGELADLEHHRAHAVHLGDAVQCQGEFIIKHTRQRIDWRRVQGKSGYEVFNLDLELGEVVHMGVSVSLKYMSRLWQAAKAWIAV